MTCIFKSTYVKRMLSDIFISLYLFNRRPKIEQSFKKQKRKLPLDRVIIRYLLSKVQHSLISMFCLFAGGCIVQS